MTEGVFLTHIYVGMDESGHKMIDVAIGKLRNNLAAARSKNDIEVAAMCGAPRLR